MSLGHNVLKVYFSNSLYGIIAWSHIVKVVSGECHKTSVISQHNISSGNGLVRSGWTSHYMPMLTHILRCHMLSLGYKESITSAQENTNTSFSRFTWNSRFHKIPQNRWVWTCEAAAGHFECTPRIGEPWPSRSALPLPLFMEWTAG